MKSPVYLIAARRTPIRPKTGDFKEVPFYELAACAINALKRDLTELSAPNLTNFSAKSTGYSLGVQSIIAGNALGAGGNPARLMALAAGLPAQVPALTVDTQCCSGLDAIGLAYERLKSARSHMPTVILAGGAESVSLAPLRQDRLSGESYDEAPFTPWPDRDPSMVDSAVFLSQARRFEQSEIWGWARKSFQTPGQKPSIAPCAGFNSDRDARFLTTALFQRSARFMPFNPVLMAPLADGAAFVALTREPPAYHPKSLFLEVLDYHQAGADPLMPGLSCAALSDWLSGCEVEFQFNRQEMVVSLMESFVVQILANIQDLSLNPDLVNPWGGLLSRGHPIGASGAVLVCELFHNLVPGQTGLAIIPAAGGLASGILVRRPT